MNLRIYLATCLAATLMTTAAWYHGHHTGWNEGRANLVEQQRAQAAAKLAKQTTRQQANDTQAAAADESRKANTEVITRDVIKYIKTPGRSESHFSAERVRIKSAAADNAACIPQFDDCSLQTGKGE